MLNLKMVMKLYYCTHSTDIVRLAFMQEIKRYYSILKYSVLILSKYFFLNKIQILNGYFIKVNCTIPIKLM